MMRLHLLVLSTWFLGNLSIHFITPFLPSIAIEKHASIHLAQMLVSSLLLGKAISMIFWGPISESYGRRRFMLLGLILFVISSLLLSLDIPITLMILLRFVQGLAVGACLLMGRTMINDKSSNPIQSLAYLFTLAGLIIPFLPFIGGYLATKTSYQHAFIFTLIYPLCLFFIMLFLLQETKPEAKRTPLSLHNIVNDYQLVLKDHVFCACLLISAFMMAGESAFNTSGSFILMQTLKLDAKHYGFAKTFLAISHLIGTYICAIIVKRKSPQALIGIGVACFAISSTIMVLFSIKTTLLNLMLPMTLYYFGTGFIVATTTACVCKPFPDKKATALGFALFLQFLISSLFSFISSSLGIHTLNGLAYILLALSLSSLWLYQTRLKGNLLLQSV